MVPTSEVLQHLKNGKEDQLSACFKNRCDQVYAYAMESPAQHTETTKGTLFGAYNAVTGYFQNVRSYRDGEAKLNSLLLGGTAQLSSQKAFTLCAHFAAKGDFSFAVN
jgi:hypothetical protein